MPHLAGFPGLCMADEAGPASPGLDCTKLHKLPGQMALAEVGGLASMLPGAHALEAALREPVTQLLVDLGPDKPDVATCQQPTDEQAAGLARGEVHIASLCILDLYTLHRHRVCQHESC